MHKDFCGGKKPSTFIRYSKNSSKPQMIRKHNSNTNKQQIKPQ